MKPKLSNSAPIYLQLCEHFRKSLVLGTMKPGEKIASVRDLALELGVNPNTMQRALSALESEGLFFSERTTGRFVTNDAQSIETLKSDYKDKIVRQFFDMMAEIGYDRKEAFEFIESQKDKEIEEGIK